MEPFPAEWRALDDRPRPAPAPPATTGASADRLTLTVAVVGACLALIATVAVLTLSSPASEVVVSSAGAAARDGGATGDLGGELASPSPSTATIVVVDVAGGVMRPGLHRLPAGSRVGDAVAAAGGFATRADATRIALELNLAEPLVDGAKVHVPLLGAPSHGSAIPPTPLASTAPAAGIPGLIDINIASSSELETLPGIGPVTASEIITARAQAPFVSVDDLLARGVVGPSTMEKIRALVTVGG